MRKTLSLSALLTAAILSSCGVSTPGAEQASRAVPSVDASMDAQVINGTPSVLGARPYQVALVSGGRQFCGGTIISESWILTAAHCLQGQSASSVTVRAGSLSATSGGQARTGSSLKIHPSYRDVTTGYDIAVLKVSSPFTFNTNVSAAALPTPAFAAQAAAVGTNHWISGWGMTVSGNTSSASTVLREALLPVAASSVCQSGLGKTITSGMLCAQVNTQKQTGCHGDSGGPFASVHNGKYFVFGAVSWGTSQYCLNGPMVFAKVETYQPWITTNSGVQPQDGSTTNPNPTPGAPTANFTSTASGLSVNFNSTSTDPDNNISTYVWNFGDGTTANGASVSKTYAAAGTYNVTLTVTDATGLSNTATKAVTVSGGTTPTPGNETFTGTISSSGSYNFHNSSTGFYYAGGTIRGSLSHATGRDFDLYLQKQNTDGTWTYVIKAATTANPEVGSYAGTAGTYRWIVHSYSGTGSYTLTVTK